MMRNISKHLSFTFVNLALNSVRLGLFAFASALTSFFFAFVSSFIAASAARA